MTLFISCVLCLTAIGQTKHEIQRKGLVLGTSIGIANSNLNFPSKY